MWCDYCGHPYHADTPCPEDEHKCHYCGATEEYVQKFSGWYWMSTCDCVDDLWVTLMTLMPTKINAKKKACKRLI